MDTTVEFKPHETTVSVGNKKLSFASISKDEQERFLSILEFVNRTYDKIFKDISDEQFLQATEHSRRMTARDYLREDNSLKKEPTTDFASAWLQGMGSLFGMDKYSISEMRQTYETGFTIGYDRGVIDASRERRNPLSHFTEEMSDREKEFYNKFLDLCNEYDMRIEYHSERGMRFYPLSV